MRFRPTIDHRNYPFGVEKEQESDRVDHLEGAGQAAASIEASDDACRIHEKGIVRKLDVSLRRASYQLEVPPVQVRQS